MSSHNMTVFGQFGTKTEKYFELCNYCKCDLGQIGGMRLNMNWMTYPCDTTSS